MKIYLAGPMSNLPQFNFPEFYRVTTALRAAGWDVVSPAELDDADTAASALKSKDGKPQDAHRTWGDYLARDVKMIANDGIEGIVFLKDWQKSRGARLEASVGLLCGLRFFCHMADDSALEIPAISVAQQLYLANLHSIKG